MGVHDRGWSTSLSLDWDSRPLHGTFAFHYSRLTHHATCPHLLQGYVQRGFGFFVVFISLQGGFLFEGEAKNS